jgi:hypothetical protein
MARFSKKKKPRYLTRNLIEILFALLVFSWSAAFADETNYPDNSRDYLAVAKAECPSIAGVSKEQCDCIVRASESISDNNPILLLFIESSIDKNKARILYNEIINGSEYSEHNFASLKDKREFVEGKGRLFVHRLSVECGFSK